MAENTLQSIVSRLVTDPDFEKTFSLDQFFSTNKEAIIKNVSANPNISNSSLRLFIVSLYLYSKLPSSNQLNLWISLSIQTYICD